MAPEINVIYETPVGPVVRAVTNGDYVTPAREIATDIEASEAEVYPAAVYHDRGMPTT